MKETELPFHSEDFRQAWEEWLQFRKESRFKKYVPTGLKKTFTHLVAISGKDERTAIKIIEQSVSQNWQGLFPLKQQINASSTSNTQRKFSRHEAGIASALADLKDNLNSYGIPNM